MCKSIQKEPQKKYVEGWFCGVSQSNGNSPTIFLWNERTCTLTSWCKTGAKLSALRWTTGGDYVTRGD